MDDGSSLPSSFIGRTSSERAQGRRTLPHEERKRSSPLRRLWEAFSRFSDVKVGAASQAAPRKRFRAASFAALLAMSLP